MTMIARIMRRFGFAPIAAEPVQQKVQYIRIPLRTGMTLDKWHAFDDNITEARKLFATPLFQDMLSVLRTSTPQGYPPRGAALNETMAAVELGRVMGYLSAIQLLESLVEFRDKPPEEVPADFGAEQILKHVEDNTEP